MQQHTHAHTTQTQKTHIYIQQHTLHKHRRQHMHTRTQQEHICKKMERSIQSGEGHTIYSLRTSAHMQAHTGPNQPCRAAISMKSGCLMSPLSFPAAALPRAREEWPTVTRRRLERWSSVKGHAPLHADSGALQAKHGAGALSEPFAQTATMQPRAGLHVYSAWGTDRGTCKHCRRIATSSFQSEIWSGC